MTAEVQRWVEAFGAREARLPALRDERRRAIERFASLGFPTLRDEDWKYTSVARIAQTDFTVDGTPAGAPEQALFAGTDGEGPRLVFVNGLFSAEASRGAAALPKGVTIAPLRQAPGSEELVGAHLARLAGASGPAFVALNTALFEDGALLHVASRVVVPEPIHVVFVSSGGGCAGFPRVLVVLEDGSEATLVETFAGQDGEVTFTNAVTEIVLGPGARLDHTRVLREGADALHVGTVEVRQARASVYASHALSLGGALTRSDLRTVLGAEWAECALDGLYLGRGREHVDHHTFIDHESPRCTSRERYKGILADAARAVFNGKVVVRQGAQKTDATQSNKNLLLSEDATIDTKPQLEIFADDVKCAHGAAVGQLDEESVFYLRARGIGEVAARAILTYGFAREIVDAVKVPALREALGHEVLRRLPARMDIT